MKKRNLCGFAAAGLLLSALATAELVSLMKSGGALTDLTDEINFFELHDTNIRSMSSATIGAELENAALGASVLIH